MNETTDTNWAKPILTPKMFRQKMESQFRGESPTEDDTELPRNVEIKRIVFNDGAEQRIDFALLWDNDLVDVYEFSSNEPQDTDKIIVAIKKMIHYLRRAHTIEIGASETKDFIVFKIEDCEGDLYYRKHDIENAIEVAECLNNLLPILERIERIEDKVC